MTTIREAAEYPTPLLHLISEGGRARADRLSKSLTPPNDEGSESLDRPADDSFAHGCRSHERAVAGWKGPRADKAAGTPAPDVTALGPAIEAAGAASDATAFRPATEASGAASDATALRTETPSAAPDSPTARVPTEAPGAAPDDAAQTGGTSAPTNPASRAPIPASPAHNGAADPEPASQT